MGTRVRNRLSPTKFAKLKTPGRHCDGGGLLLQIAPSGARSWIFRFQVNKRKRDMGLGSADAIGLADARELAAQCRSLLAKGTDPIEAKQRGRHAKALQEANKLTFQECALKLIDAKRPSWKDGKQAEQWQRSLEAYAFPVLGKFPVGAVDTNLVLKVLEPLWQTKGPTAGRLRERIEAVLDAAKARGQREGDNPARWRGHLENLLPKISKTHRIVHHPALHYNEIGKFLADLRQQNGTAALAMEFLILTATRTSETLEAKWVEIDLESATWTIPSERIKAGKEHRIPISKAAVSILLNMKKQGQEGYIFPSRRPNKPLCKMIFHKLLERMGRDDITTHGFRSTFRDWAAEQTNFPREVAEMALAHAIENKVEAAYRRGGLFEKRAKLMAAWAIYCASSHHQAKVVPFGTASIRAVKPIGLTG